MLVSVDASDCGSCREEWRVWLCDLVTGRIHRTIDFVTASFEPIAGKPGRGSIVFHREGVAMRDMYPHQTMIVFERLVNTRRPIPSSVEGSVPDAVADFVGIVETLSMGLDGLVTLGIAEIDRYFEYRLIRHNLNLSGQHQNNILANLFRYGTNYSFADPDPNSINLRTFSYDSAITRDRTYLASERKNLGKVISQLTNVINGPSYYVTGFRLGEIWVPSIITYDDDTSQVVDTSVATFDLGDMSDVAMELDGNGQALLVDALGAERDTDDTPLIRTAFGSLLNFPQYHAKISFPDVTIASTLDEHAAGHLNTNKDLSPRLAFPVPNILEHPDSRVILPGVTRCTVRIPGRYMSVLGYFDDDEPFIVTRVGYSVGPEQRTSAVVEVASTFVAPKVISAEEVPQPLQECEDC